MNCSCKLSQILNGSGHHHINYQSQYHASIDVNYLNFHAKNDIYFDCCLGMLKNVNCVKVIKVAKVIKR